MTTAPLPSPTFRALVLNLVALTDGVLPGAVGELAHAAFYAAIRSVDPDLAARMHDEQARAAFALSPLYGYWRSPQDRTIHVNAGQPGWLRVCILDERLFQVFLEHLMGSALPAIRLGEVHLGITSVLGAPGSHPWVGYTTLDELRSLTAAPDHWVLQFESPTAIRWGEADNKARRVELFPAPRMAVASLRTRWDRLTGDLWGLEFEQWVERNMRGRPHLAVAHRDLPLPETAVRGGMGKLEYRVLDGSRTEAVAHLNRLLHLAFYAGIGYKTTHGLGMVRIVE